MRRWLSLWLWRHRRDWILDKNGFINNTIHLDAAFLEVFVELLAERRSLVNLRELHNLFRFVEKTAHVPGAIAEVGVYRGGSARLLCAFKGDRMLHLFDTFEGMPAPDPRIDKHHAGDFADSSLEDVRNYLARFSHVQFHPGWFPATTSEVTGERFSLVHLDVDLYQSTRDALEFFYPRMNPGGFIVTHDYSSISCPGVRKAFDEFFALRPEKPIPLWDTQCAVSKAI